MCVQIGACTSRSWWRTFFSMTQNSVLLLSDPTDSKRQLPVARTNVIEGPLRSLRRELGHARRWPGSSPPPNRGSPCVCNVTCALSRFLGELGQALGMGWAATRNWVGCHVTVISWTNGLSFNALGLNVWTQEGLVFKLMWRKNG